MLDDIRQWFREAVDVHGDDWPKVEQYVSRKMADLSPADRARLLHEFSAMQPLDSGLFN